MVDRAALFTALTLRNAQRKAAHLPLLDLKAELAHQTALAVTQDCAVLAVQHADQRDWINIQVMIDLTATHGAAFIDSMAGRWTIKSETQRRFDQFLHDLLGVATTGVVARHPIRYGAAAEPAPGET